MDRAKLFNRILFGSFNKLDEEFDVTFNKNKDDNRYRQSQVMVAVACVHSFIYRATNWCQQTLDDSMEFGDGIYHGIEVKSRKKGLEVTGANIVRSIRLGFERDDGKYICEFLYNKSFSGQFKGFPTKFKKYMDSTDVGWRCVLFKCKKVSFGIFDYSDSNGGFCLYDPHGRNEDGYFDYTAKSCILYFDNIDRLFELLARDDLFAYSTYECVPIHLIEFDGSKPMWVLTAFGDDPSSSDDELRSSDDELPSSDGEELPESAVVVKTKSGRTSQPPNRLQFDCHPSFYRGKEREDAKRMKRNSENFAMSKDEKTAKLYKKYRSRCKRNKGKLYSRRGNSILNFKNHVERLITSGKF